MASTQSNNVAPEEISPSPFAGSNQTESPHTSINSLPEVPTPMGTMTGRRRRSETQELKTKVELLGTKVST